MLACTLHNAAPATLHNAGVNIIVRVMGLILAAIAVEFITGGLLVLLPGLG